MSLIKRLLVVLLALSAVICLAACGGEDASESKADNAKPDKVTESTDAGEENKAEAGTDADQTEDEDIQQNESVPQHETAVESIVESADELVDYTVKVVDSEGNPVANTLVQLCTDSSCLAPKMTDAEGVAVFSQEANEFKACVTGTEDYYYFDGATEVTIVYDAPVEG